MNTNNTITKLDISGMHCASCSLLIKKSLESKKGVVEANVNYSTGKAVIKHDANNTKIKDLIEAVTSAGYGAISESESTTSESQKRAIEVSYWKAKLLFSTILSIPLAVFMVFDFLPRLALRPLIMPYAGIISLISASIALFIIGKNFFQGAFSALRLRTFTMDSLIATGTSAAFFYSLYEFFKHLIETQTLLGLNGMMIENLYFEVATFLITFVILGKYLEAVAKGKTSDSLSKLVEIRPTTANIFQNGKVSLVEISQVKIGQTILIRSGEQVPLDGHVISGQTSIDESLLTGESMPVDKLVGSTVYAGTLNQSGSIEVKVTKLVEDTALSQVIKLVAEAQSSQAPIQNLADKISAYFVPSIIIIALLTLVLTKSILAFVAVLVIACPCALGLATPTAIMVATGVGARLGILFKGGEAIEKSSHINTIVFDKTGTLTTGHPIVTKFSNLSKLPDSKILSVIYSLESRSEHPIGKSIVDYVHKKHAKLLKVSSSQAVVGFGITGVIANTTYFIGKTDTHQIALQKDGVVLATLEVADTLKNDAIKVISSLLSQKYDIYLVTGDNQLIANDIASELGIPTSHVYADVLPGGKADIIKQLQSVGKKVAFVGDGINDSVALTQSNLGIALSTGSDIAIESGEVVIMNNNLHSVSTALNLGRDTVSKVKQNLFFALFYNVLGIPIAARVFSSWGISLKPELAGLAMAFSSVSVVVNSLLLNRFKPNSTNNLSRFAPVIMSLGFLLVFFEFTRLSSDISLASTVKISPQVLLTSSIKNAYASDTVPKLFAINPDPTQKGMVLGYAEAKMMKDEGLFTKVGDKLYNFFGLPEVTIIGIAAPTNSLVDHFHFFDLETFNNISGQNNIFISSTPTKDLKLFSVVSGQPGVSLGFSEAQMMKAEKLISGRGSTLTNFFGNKLVTVGSIYPRRNSAADMMHFVSPEFRDNYLKSLDKF